MINPMTSREPAEKRGRRASVVRVLCPKSTQGSQWIHLFFFGRIFYMSYL
jgi:hypothetical protein